MIDKITIDKIMDAANIVDVVSEFVSLRKAGVNYKGLCPFHDDKTPSFMVSPSKNICHCFACGKGGTPVSFLMEHEQITYPEALRWLARKYSIDIEERELTAEEKQEQNDRESMFIVNEWAKNYFRDILTTHVDGQAIGKAYFRSRGIRDDIMEKFQLGYALSVRQSLSQAALGAGYKEEYILKTGLCYKKENGELVDRYAGRVIFPWFNVSGRIVAFGGRLLDSRTKGVQQKYVNSPDSEIYHKERELYGLFQAKHAIAKLDCVYMVEGYTDVIAMHQSGIENVVANSGTALSVYQIRLLRRFTSNIVLLYDGDEAGIHAAMRGTDMLLSEGMNIKVLVLPDGDDPDSFARKHSSSEFREYIEEHQTDFIEFKTHALLEGVTDPIKRSEAISNIVKSVSLIPDQITRDTYLRECTQRLNMSEHTLIATMNRYIQGDIEEHEKNAERERRREEQGFSIPDNIYSAPSPVVQAADTDAPEVETMLIQAVIRYGEAKVFDEFETEDGETVVLSVAQFVDYNLSEDNLLFKTPIYNQILGEACDKSEEADFIAETYFTHHPDIQISNIASRLTINRYQLSKSLEINTNDVDIKQKVLHLISDFRMDLLDQRLRELQGQLKQVGNDMDKIRILMTEYKDVQQRRDKLARLLGNDIII